MPNKEVNMENYPNTDDGPQTAPELPKQFITELPKAIPPKATADKKSITSQPKDSIKESESTKVAGSASKKKEEPQVTEQTYKSQEEPLADARLDDAETDRAIGDIEREEADTLLAVEDAFPEIVSKERQSGIAKPQRSPHKGKWVWLGLLIIVLILLALFLAYGQTN